MKLQADAIGVPDNVLLLPLFIFLLGISFGSFIHVVIDRTLSGQSFLKGRSHCDFCKKKLFWYDLIPLLSFVLLGGKCRYCKKFFGFLYPFSELLTGSICVVIFLFWQQLFSEFTGFSVMVLLYMLFVGIFSSGILLADIKYGIIPDLFLFPLFVTTLLYNSVQKPEEFIGSIFACFGAFLFFYLLHAITKGKGMGLGDVKLAGFIGLFLGFPQSIFAIYLAFLTGAGVSLILILWGRKSMKNTIVFGPFLIIGMFVTWLFYPSLLAFAIKVLHL